MKITTGLEYQVKVDICEETGRVEIIKYKNPVRIDLANNFKSGIETNEMQYMENKRKTILKSAKKIMQLVRYNAGQYVKGNGMGVYPPAFLTLTFAENVQDWNYANREFSKFIQRLNYKVYGEKCTKLAYIGVPELQERGAIHYHVLFFNLPYVDKGDMQELWGLGRTRIEIEKMRGMQGENLGRYITKYMVKQFYSKDKKGQDVFYYDKDMWEGKKIYFASRNLYRPSTYRLTQEEYLDISWVLEGENVSSELIVATLNMPTGKETVEFGSRDEYSFVDQDKISFLNDALIQYKDRYIKSDFAIGQKNNNIKKMIRLDKVVKESPKERYARIKEGLELDNKWDLIGCGPNGTFVEVDMEYIF